MQVRFEGRTRRHRLNRSKATGAALTSKDAPEALRDSDITLDSYKPAIAHTRTQARRESEIEGPTQKARLDNFGQAHKRPLRRSFADPYLILDLRPGAPLSA